ncbi:MAG: hypothetical protein ACUVQ1_03890 [Candidatus Kapaibacteriales bacterium]
MKKNQNPKSFISFYIWFTFLVTVLSSCNELPTELTFPLLYDTVSIYALSSDTINFFKASETIYSPARIFNTGAIFVGAFNGFRAASLIRFTESNLPDSLDWLTSDRIYSIELELIPNRYIFGDSVSPNFAFKVYLIKEFWSNQVTWDSLFNDWVPNNKVDLTPIGSFNGGLTLKDTMDTVSIPLQNSFIIEWIQKNKDSIPIWGILLAPEPSCNVIYQFKSQYVSELAVSKPRLTVKYRYKDESTRIWYVHSAIDASVVEVPKLVNKNSILIQSGYSYWSSLTFDVSKIPLFSAIHYAELELTIDPSKTTYGNQGIDTVFEGAYYENRKLDTVPLVTFYGYRKGDKVIFPKVSTPIELWTKGEQTGKLYLHSYHWSDFRSLNRTGFYGLDANDPRLRPKLKVIYSQRRK